MNKHFKSAVLTILVLSMMAVAIALYGNFISGVNAASKDSTPVFDLQDHGGVFVMNPKTRGSSDLVRTVDNISMNIDTTDLPIGAYSVWWVIFNNPAGCSDGVCGENDVLPPPGTAEAEVSVLWATGGIVGPDRGGHFSARLGVGKDNAPGQIIFGDGLTNSMGSEVHMIVRYHGPARWDDAEALKSQMHSFQGFCTPASSLGVGTDESAFSCFEPQAAMHMAPSDSMSR
jgi:hypothetical protein